MAIISANLQELVFVVHMEWIIHQNNDHHKDMEYEPEIGRND